MNDFEAARARMVSEQIHARGVRDPKVLVAMGKVRREEFVPTQHRHLAYEDTPLPIEAEQTSSQPYIVAYMIAAEDQRAPARTDCDAR